MDAMKKDVPKRYFALQLLLSSLLLPAIWVQPSLRVVEPPYYPGEVTKIEDFESSFQLPIDGHIITVKSYLRVCHIYGMWYKYTRCCEYELEGPKGYELTDLTGSKWINRVTLQGGDTYPKVSFQKLYITKRDKVLEVITVPTYE